MADGAAAAAREASPGAKDKGASESERIQQVLDEVLAAAGLERLALSNDPEKKSDEGARRSTEPREESKPPDERKGAGPRPLSATLPPRPVTEFVDITAVFSEAAAELSPGELVQEDNFSLFDAMSAIELMDSKMDAALQWNNFQDYPRTVHEAIERGLLKLDGHSPAELVGITDEVLACVATWLEGHTLAQTVFTCLYLLDTAAIGTLSLRAFSQAVVKCVEFMREGICRGAVYSDDDQQGVCFGFDMLKVVSDSSVSTALREAEERTQNLLKHCSSSSRTKESTVAPDNVAQGSVAPDSVAPGKVADSKVLKALLHRIRFIRSFFTFVCCIRKETSQGIENALQKVSHCLSLVDPILASMELGSKFDPSNPLALGFHPVINQRLLPPSYKQYQILPRPEGMRVLREVLGQVKTALGFGRIDSFMELRCAVVNFCSEGKSPNVFARSLIVSHCLQSERQKLFGGSPPEALLKDDVRAFINPSSLNPRSPVSTFAKELIDAFFVKASIPMIDLLRTYCHHRARQRQKIVRCLDALGDIQQEYERMDQQLNSLTRTMDPQRQHLGCFSTWLLYHLVILMIEYVVLGFEYDLYSPFELHYTYWYLEYLYGWFYTTMKSAEKLFLSERAAAPGKGKRKAKKKEFSKEKEREAAVAQAKRMACIGTMRAMEALLLDNKVPQPTFEFGSQEFCFQHRFLPFSSIGTPQLLSYADYIRLAGIDNYKGREVNLYDAAAKHFVSARTAIEGVHRLDSEMEALLKVVKTNTVIMNLAAKGHKKGSQAPPLDFSLHRHFPVIRIN